MINNSNKKLTEKQKISRKKRRNKKKRISNTLSGIIQSKNKEIVELKEKIKLLEGELLLYKDDN